MKKKSEKTTHSVLTPILKNDKKSAVGTLQSTFNQHRRKIDQLRRQIEELKEECEQALVIYHSEIKPQKQKTAAVVIQFLLRVKELTQPPKALNKKEREILKKDILENSVNLTFHLLPYNDIPAEIKSLYQEVFGKSTEDDFQDGLSEIKKMFKECTGSDDIDLSQVDPNDSPQEIMRKIMESFHERRETADNNEMPPPPPPKEKSKKQLLKEQKARELEVLQDKCLNSIYKRLAKVLHPDLEQDVEKRAEKTALMKQLTIAYENNDLVSLLALESQWLGEVELAAATLSEENLRVYNALLKDQIEDLKEEVSKTIFHPRYFEIHDYIKESPTKPLMGIKSAFLECENIMKDFSIRLNDLSGKDPLKFLKKVLAEFAQQDENDEFFSPAELIYLLEDLMGSDMFDDFEKPKPRKKKKSQ